MVTNVFGNCLFCSNFNKVSLNPVNSERSVSSRPARADASVSAAGNPLLSVVTESFSPLVFPDDARLPSDEGRQQWSLPETGQEAVLQREVQCEVRFHECRALSEKELFVQLRDSLQADKLLMLTRFSVDDYISMSTKLFIDEEQRGGFGLNPDGELISVFSLGGQRIGAEIVKISVTLGARAVSCFDIHGKLPALYMKEGFCETGRVPWDQSKAPAGWNYERFGQPDVVILRHGLLRRDREHPAAAYLHERSA